MPNDPAIQAGPGRPKDLAKRQAILEAARDLFLSNGYANTSMDAVAAAAGVSKLTVYSHFTDKETLCSSAVIATCQAQLPELFFELPDGAPIETVLTTIGRGFQALINGNESIKLHRLIMALGSQDPRLSQIFFEAGPQRVLHEMEGLLKRIDARGELRIDLPRHAAEHFFCLLKGAANFRLLLGYAEAPDATTAEAHVQEVVALFMRAYRP
ncbi:TetR/AcrR family transcriptional regulator [Pseudomonas sp. R5(2019)]|uniref:TetR/AcrR family transcriptional regulator n=1 Tax=Pseudomonas sp. R5(2019) TaxID=2697566 RepID=UPI0014120CD3|nr:TetR/AcrR family transcriptional regulator [Pseudomonas sp. R5(2019)]NBA94519.1 TetR family transcriptional regulator [Pseudomonas sp. R5(2019)]